ncbi:hypothetical protein CIG75_10195 [Tumebacillus algifaecis]|uniref:ATPase BadF/BadG/BcrA/BcrD type domain-containing protein n=1 Tax=Tumebacillus algifaecis TaxID=1214604 RepID=A0A223D1R3_9BACL|nr:BadF/BadG/BcrA/BcrD ATPase family protein [Tumebacillus algifaecis]ASS75324.1 hypothetical protein CIG75_10195 [Tumebacillus algifaecis]
MKAFVGVDGGGSKTRAVVVTETGEWIADIVTAGSNVNHFGWERTQSVLQDLFVKIRAALPPDVRIHSLFFGVAGVDRPEARARMTEWIASRFPEAIVEVESDTLPALVSGSGETAGIVLIGGTGSIAFGINEQGEQCRVGGWGYLIGDEGSGYAIGKDACAMVMRSFDGRGPQTLLTAKLLDFYNVETPPALIPLVYATDMTREQIAGATRFVFEAAQEGDAVSIDLLSKAADELSDLVRTMLGRLSFKKERVPVVLTGGLFHEGSPLLDMVRGRLSERVDVVRSTHPPVVGAVSLAFKQGGATPGDHWEQTLVRIK